MLNGERFSNFDLTVTNQKIPDLVINQTRIYKKTFEHNSPNIPRFSQI
jgi:hypothetical protein